MSTRYRSKSTCDRSASKAPTRRPLNRIRQLFKFVISFIKYTFLFDFFYYYCYYSGYANTRDGDRLTGISMDCMLRSQIGGRALGRVARRYVVAAATSPVPTHTGVETLLTYWLTLSRLSKPSRYRRSMLKMLPPPPPLLLRSFSSVVRMWRQRQCSA